MKSVFSLCLKTLVSLTLVLAACAKNDNGNGGSGQATGPVVPPPVPCSPDQFGNVPSNCGSPVTISAGFTGSVSGHDRSSSNRNSIVRLISRMHTYPVFSFQPGFGKWYSGANGLFVVTSGFSTPFKAKCGTADGIGGTLLGMSCTSECKNFKSRMQLSLSVNQGYGTLQIAAGPYLAPGGCNPNENGMMRAADLAVRVYNTGGNQGFTIRTIPSFPQGGNYIQIDVPTGSVDPNVQTVTYNGTISLNGEVIGNVILSRR